MKRIVYGRPDGGVSILTPVISIDDERMTEEQALARSIKRVPDYATNVRVVEASEIPQDRSFRNAWKPDLTVDMPKAREIHRDKLRQLRAPKLAGLDIEMSRAYNDPTKQAQIETTRQALRDVTADPAIEAAKTPDELREVLPDALKGAGDK